MIKNVIKENRVPVNKFKLVVQPGVGEITLVSVSGIEEELDATELPDRTVRSGGRSKPFEPEIVQPMHHDIEVLAMESWYNMCKFTLPGYLKIGVLIQFDEYGFPRRKYTLQSLWIKKRVHSDLELDNEGEMSVLTWTLSADQLLPAG